MIIYWKTDNLVYPYLNNNGTIALFENLEATDITANNIEKDKKVEARVISIEGVKE